MTLAPRALTPEILPRFAGFLLRIEYTKALCGLRVAAPCPGHVPDWSMLLQQAPWPALAPRFPVAAPDPVDSGSAQLHLMENTAASADFR
ncbi:MAG: hypothetical protein K2X06_11760 [Burkholderiales bacterium]|nr:hypothetical protein [Burkholderiales bacterium]